MEAHLIAFSALAWEQCRPGVREKRLARGSEIVRLLELGPEYEHPGWCETGHLGFILSGVLRLEFDGGAVLVGSGDGFRVEAGFHDRHRPVVAEAPVRMLLVESAGPEGSVSAPVKKDEPHGSRESRAKA